MNSIKEHLLQLENDLLKSEIRKSSQIISEILANDFIEFCSNVSEYHYKNGDVFQEQSNNNILHWEILNFEIKELSNDCILAMYKVINHNEVDKTKKYSLRSSIWKNYDGKWEILFHQGTLSSKSEIEINL
ncbi:MAG: nuclear transport factor 2 family protein [Ruminiclostridium sp.]